MNLPTRNTLILGIGALLILATSFIAGYILQKSKFVNIQEGERPFAPVVSPTVQRRPVPGSDAFSVRGYIQPLENNAIGSIYSDKAQLRGVVSSWGEAVVTVNVADKDLTVSVPETVEFKCFPLINTDANGVTHKMSEVFVDLRNSQGIMTEISSIKEKMPVGSEITVRVDVQEGDSLVANYIVGYGCSI